MGAKFWLNNIKNLDDLKKIFVEQFNWELNNSTSFFSFDDNLINKIKEQKILFNKDRFKIYYFDLKNIENPYKDLKKIEKQILYNSEIKNLFDESIFIFTYDNFNYLDFIKAEKISNKIKIRKFSIDPTNRDKLRTPSEQLEKLKLEKSDYIYIKEKIESAFNLEAVTEKFYKEYIAIFEKIKKELSKQKVDWYAIKNYKKEKEQEYLRDFIHQVLNRIMFLYFVQKRGCFGEDINFLANFWNGYKEKFKNKNEFHHKWLNVLFFDSLSKPSWSFNEKNYLEEFNQILKMAPYLNGGLFQEIDLDNVGWLIFDDLFEEIFQFFESYNFTVTESTPFDIEIAIDPEMLGNIYEYLVSSNKLEKEQAKAGIFYTPKIEIELMIRRSLVEFLFNKLNIEKGKLYQFIFQEIEEGKQIENPFNEEEAKSVLKELENILILDPACGSGHYLVVAENILFDLKKILYKKIKKEFNPYEEKKKIIEMNIYGNDIKEWAVNVAKLRLWLDLFVDADEKVLKNQIEPLLPNLNFKIRHGDSLVQRIGNELVPLRKVSGVLKNEREYLKELERKKLAVYENKVKSEEVISLEKNLLFRVLFRFEHEASENFKSKKREKDAIENPSFLPFQKVQRIEPDKKELAEIKEEINKLEKELERIKKIREELSSVKEPPMIWDLAFAEVFQRKDKNGFDIVIANPPYVRQEAIEDLTEFYSKKEYKEKLIEQTKEDWGYEFGRKEPFQIDKRSDLYVYFYLKGLKLLNENGVLCYISSNSWLDVGFGGKLQEVFIRRTPIVAIYDNQAKRSFKHADINTIIAIIKAPKTKDFDEEVKNNEVRFVMFKKPFEEVMFSEIFIDLEKDYDLKQYQEGKRRETEIYRLHIVNQKDLYEFGKDKNGIYVGNKWGGKYLRAPEIYWKILEKGKDKLARLGDIAEVRAGIITGNNKKFYKKISKDYYNRNEFAPVFKSPRDHNKIILKKSDAIWLIKIKDIHFEIRRAPLLWVDLRGDKHLVHFNKDNIPHEHTFYGIKPFKSSDLEKIVFLLNCSLSWLFIEIYGRIGLGGGAIRLIGDDIVEFPILNPDLVENINKNQLLIKFFNREILKYSLEMNMPDRKALDDIVFDALGLTAEERKEVYWAVAELVQNRLKKAESV